MANSSPQSFVRRFLAPVLQVFAVMALSFFAYRVSHRIDSDALGQLFTTVFGTTYFLSIALGTLYVYTVAQVRGASMKERIAASFVNPFIWATKEVVVLSTSHPFVECLYWYLNPLSIWLAIFMVMQMGIATLIARRILNKRGKDLKVLTAGPVITIVVFLGIGILVYAWGKGENIYVLFLEGYRQIFGVGI